MDDRHPIRAFRFLQALAGVFDPTLVVPLCTAFRVGHPDDAAFFLEALVDSDISSNALRAAAPFMRAASSSSNAGLSRAASNAAFKLCCASAFDHDAPVHFGVRVFGIRQDTYAAIRETGNCTLV